MTTGGVMVKIEVKTEVEVDTHQLNIEVITLFYLGYLNFSYLCIAAVIARTVEEEQMDLVTVCFVAEWNERM